MNRRALVASTLAAAGLLAILLGGIVLVPRLLYPPLTAAYLRGVPTVQSRIQLQQAQSQLADDARSAVLQGLAGLLVVIGAVATWRQVHISREGQLTDRFSRAVDQLGSPNADVRIGALYALERIARNSPADREPIQYMLGAYIRTHSPWPVGVTGGPEHPTATVDEQLPWMRVRAPDIQAAMGVLGRIAQPRNQPVIYLSRVDLRSIALRPVERLQVPVHQPGPRGPGGGVAGPQRPDRCRPASGFPPRRAPQRRKPHPRLSARCGLAPCRPHGRGPARGQPHRRYPRRHGPNRRPS